MGKIAKHDSVGWEFESLRGRQSCGRAVFSPLARGRRAWEQPCSLSSFSQPLLQIEGLLALATMASKAFKRAADALQFGNAF